ncbi:hypothetical protein Nepgr_009227 [Nepenthes gracilis]|uniref:Uncharacterized protein n=1 Tax=Nepenthes gracilis TaxID=150966 RepID=A0AAD3SAB9_NEPGR|nr:hypothetical protein Nepgr_009227 [Nepenthes gracilis]
MEHRKGLLNSSSDQKSLGADTNTAAPRTRHGMKLRDILMSGNPSLSYTDFDIEITRNVDNMLSDSLGKQQSQGTKKKAITEDELVKYMSKLPSYLEKGKNFQENALSVGVLDWGRLEKWQYDNKQLPPKNVGYSPSSSITSFFSTDGSSTHSSRGQSWSPAHQRMHHHASQCNSEVHPKQKSSQEVQSYNDRGQKCFAACQSTRDPVPQLHHPKAYPWEVDSQSINHFGGTAGKFEQPSTSAGKTVNEHVNPFGTNRTSGGIQSENRLERCEIKQSDSKSTSEMGKWQASDNYEVVSSGKGKLKTQDRESAKKLFRLQASNLNGSDQDCSKGLEDVVLVLPRGHSQNICSGLAHLSDLSTANDCMLAESRQRCFSVTNNCGKDHCSDFCSDGKEHTERISACTASGLGVKVSSQPLQRRPHLDEKLGCQSKSNSGEEKVSIPLFNSPSGIKPSTEMDIRTPLKFNRKTRNSLPISRFGFGIARIISNANSSSRDTSPQCRSISKDIASKSGPERAAAFVSSDDSCGDKLRANNRSKSSPLRRLLDPLLKPKGSHRLHITEQLSRDSTSTVGPCKSADEQADCPNLHSMKVKSRLRSGRVSGVNGAYRNSKHGSSSFQALLQVAAKNGIPLFTFAVDNNSDILAATLRKPCTPEKNHYSWTYTFFTICGIKRKSGIWSNQGIKANDHGYVSNVVAQMKSSDPQFPNFAGQTDMNGDNVREFALFAVDMGQVDQHAAEFHATNELAAIIVKLRKTTTGSPTKDGLPSSKDVGKLQACSHELGHLDLGNDSVNGLAVSQNFLSTTVILPGGVHTIPSRGEMSTLTQRWTSGGSCDCGGWDLGCQLRIYASQNELEKKSSSSETSNYGDEFKLFSQVVQESDHPHPVLSLSPLKDMIYLAQFDYSISILQAFAICIAYLDCRRPSELLEPIKKSQETAPGLTIPRGPDQIKVPNQSQEAPSRPLSYHPHSPIGRV